MAFQDICIYITDGVSNVDSGQTIPEARLVTNAGVTVIAIGIALSDTRELKSIASQPRFMFNVDNFDDLEELALKMVIPLCSGSCKLAYYFLQS